MFMHNTFGGDELRSGKIVTCVQVRLWMCLFTKLTDRKQKDLFPKSHYACSSAHLLNVEFFNPIVLLIFHTWAYFLRVWNTSRLPSRTSKQRDKLEETTVHISLTEQTALHKFWHVYGEWKRSELTFICKGSRAKLFSMDLVGNWSTFTIHGWRLISEAVHRFVGSGFNICRIKSFSIGFTVQSPNLVCVWIPR